MSDELEPYEVFAKQMETRFPKMFAESYGGFACGEGWWPIIESLCANIQHHIDWKEKQRDWAIRFNSTAAPEDMRPVPDAIPQVTLDQVKEKFGTLRFYYTGGDDYISGMVTMAESWAGRACETCGAPGTSGGRGWISTLCPTHRAEADARYAERFKE
jgi:hypothetical protein